MTGRFSGRYLHPVEKIDTLTGERRLFYRLDDEPYRIGQKPWTGWRVEFCDCWRGRALERADWPCGWPYALTEGSCGRCQRGVLSARIAAEEDCGLRT